MNCRTWRDGASDNGRVAIDWTGCAIVERDPEKLHGAATVRGLRLTPETVVENFEAGLSVTEIHEQCRAVAVRDIRRVLGSNGTENSLKPAG